MIQYRKEPGDGNPLLEFVRRLRPSAAPRRPKRDWLDEALDTAAARDATALPERPHVVPFDDSRLRMLDEAANVSTPDVPQPRRRPVTGPVAADAAAVPIPRAPRPVESGTIGADEVPAVVRTAQQAEEDEIRRRSEEWQEVPGPVRGAVSAGKGVVDAVTLGLADDAIAAGTKGLSKLTGKEIADPYAEFEELERGTGERLAELGGFAAGAGGLIGAQNTALARAGRALPEGSRGARALGTFGPDAGLSRGATMARNIAEGVPYDLAYDAETPEQRLLNVGLGVAGGVGLGALTPKGGARAADEVGDVLPKAALVGTPPAPVQKPPLAGTRVVDESGQPKRVFHGTSAAFETFDESNLNPGSLYGPGYYFTDDPLTAGGDGGGAGFGYANKGGGGAPNVRPARLDIRSPFDIDATYTGREANALLDRLDPDADVVIFHDGEQVSGEDIYRTLTAAYGGEKYTVNEALRDAGFDGITHIGGARTGNQPHRVWIAFERPQIRSAFDPPESARQVGLVDSPPAAAGADLGEDVRAAIRGTAGGAAYGAAAGEDGERLETAIRVGLGAGAQRGVGGAAARRMGVDLAPGARMTSESGAVSPGMVRAIASTGAGAVVGGGVDAASGDDSPLDGALLGGAAGAGAAAALPSILRRARDARGTVGEQLDDAGAAVMDPPASGLTDEDIGQILGTAGDEPRKARNLYRRTREQAKGLSEAELKIRYRRALRSALTAEAGAAGVEGKGLRRKTDYADPDLAIGAVGTGVGGRQRGLQSQADARLQAMGDELRERGLDVPHADDAFMDARTDEVPPQLRDELVGLRGVDDETLAERLAAAEEAAGAAPDDLLAQVRRSMLAGEVRRREFDLLADEPLPGAGLEMEGGRPAGEPPLEAQAPDLPRRVNPNIDPEKYVNLAKFATDPSGEERLKREAARVAQAIGWHPKPVIGWDETKAIADELGLDPADLMQRAPQRMTGAEGLALRNIISSNLAEVEAVSIRLADTTLAPAQREAMTSALNALEAQNAALLSKFIQARTEAGRTLNAYKILANRTLAPEVWLAKAQQLAGAGYDEEVRATLMRLLKKGDRAELVQYMASLRKSSPREKAVTLWKAGLLTNPLTHVVNVTGNLVHGAFLAFAEQPAAFFDWALSKSTGIRTKTGLSGTTLAAAAKGARKGLDEARLVLKGVPLDDALAKYDIPAEVSFDNRILDVYTKSIFRSLGAMDRVFRGAALHASLAEQAQVLAKAEGLRGAERKARVQALIAEPSDEMALRAIHAAERATFTNQTKAGQIMGQAARTAPVLDVVFPFKRTPSAIGSAVIEYSPLGVASGAWKVFRLAMKGKAVPEEQLRAVQRLGRSTTALAPIALGYTMYKAGVATGSYSTETDRRNESELEQKPHNAVLIDGTWYSVGRISPVGNLIALGANIAAAGEDEASFSERVAEMGFSAIKTVADQPMLTGLQDVTAAATDPARFAGGYVRSLAGSVIPAGVGAVTRATDEVVRKPDGVVDIWKSRIPGLSRTVEPKVNALGDEVKRGDQGVSALLNPFQSQRDRRQTDRVVAELSRLNASGMVSPLQRDKGTSLNIHNARQRKYGRRLRRELAALFKSEEYVSVPDRAAAAVKRRAYAGEDPAQMAHERRREMVEDKIRDVRRSFSAYEKRERERSEREGQ